MGIVVSMDRRLAQTEPVLVARFCSSIVVATDLWGRGKQRPPVEMFQERCPAGGSLELR